MTDEPNGVSHGVGAGLPADVKTDLSKWIVVTSGRRTLIGCPTGEDDWDGVRLCPAFELVVMTQLDGQGSVRSQRVVLPIDMFASCPEITVRPDTRWPLSALHEDELALVARDICNAIQGAQRMRAAPAGGPRIVVPR
jgi:hypothetical protein